MDRHRPADFLTPLDDAEEETIQTVQLVEHARAVRRACPRSVERLANVAKLAAFDAKIFLRLFQPWAPVPSGSITVSGAADSTAIRSFSVIAEMAA